MSLRVFTDAAGHEWQAFDVIPRKRERRRYERRVSGKAGGADERRRADRRLTVGGTAGIAGAEGWLCFERGDDLRRLSPIPDGWTRADDEELAQYCEAARPVRRTSASFRQVAERER